MVLGAAVLAGTLVWCWPAAATAVDPAGTAPWAVLAAGLLFSPIAWHNYLLLWPGVLLLLAGAGQNAAPVPARPCGGAARRGRGPGVVERGVAARCLVERDLGRSLYCAVLLAYWWVLLSSARVASEPRQAGWRTGSRARSRRARRRWSPSAPPPASRSRTVARRARGVTRWPPGVASRAPGGSVR